MLSSLDAMLDAVLVPLSDVRFWHDNVPRFFCGGMVLCFAAWAQAYLRPTRRTGLAVQWLADRPFWSEETVGLDERRIKAAELIRERASPELEQAFDLFKSQWKRHAAVMDGREISTVDVADVITVESLLPERFAAWFAPSIPGFFTGAGLLGTVVGLVLGLKGVGFGGGPASSGPSFVGSVSSLLAGMYTAFTASIGGIGLSLAWNAADGACRGRLEQAVERFHRAIRAIYPVRTQVDLLLALVSATERPAGAEGEALRAALDAIAANQSAAIERFASEALVAYKTKLTATTAELQTMLQDADEAMKQLRETLMVLGARGASPARGDHAPALPSGPERVGRPPARAGTSR